MRGHDEDCSMVFLPRCIGAQLDLNTAPKGVFQAATPRRVSSRFRSSERLSLHSGQAARCSRSGWWSNFLIEPHPNNITAAPACVAPSPGNLRPRARRFPAPRASVAAGVDFTCAFANLARLRFPGGVHTKRCSARILALRYWRPASSMLTNALVSWSSSTSREAAKAVSLSAVWRTAARLPARYSIRSRSR